MVLTLYKFNTSPPARAVMMTIEALEISDVKYVDVNVFKKEHLTEEYLQMNPQHTIPLLKDGDFVIWDSHAICSYLVNVYGKDDSLYPKDPQKRAVTDQRLHFDSGILFPTLYKVALPIVYDGVKEIPEESLNKVLTAYEFTDKFLTADWIAGDDLTLADICCICNISTLNVLVPIDKDKYIHLWTWLQRCSKLAFYKKINEPGLQELQEMLQETEHARLKEKYF